MNATPNLSYDDALLILESGVTKRLPCSPCFAPLTETETAVRKCTCQRSSLILKWSYS